MRLIDSDNLLACIREVNPYHNDLIEWGCKVIYAQPTVEAVPVIRCKDCKHRPVYDEQKREMPPRLNIEYDEDGEPWIWDEDMACPYLCGDSYYNQMPDDEQFCDRGERKEE